jgi:hypothetical protein
MIGFCRHCNHLSLTLDENKICRICRRLTEIKRPGAHSHTPDDHDVMYRGNSALSEQSDNSKEDFFEGGASGGGGASGDFSIEDSLKDSPSSDNSNSDTGSNDSGSDSLSDSGGSDD